MKLLNIKKEVVDTNRVLCLSQLSRDAVYEVQYVLKNSEYYKGFLDGIAGPKTEQALVDFKTDNYQSDPKWIGAGTVKLLVALNDKASVSEQDKGNRACLTINKQTGTYTGKSVLLPNKDRVYANELIVPGVPLTWGEMTKGLTRVPHSVEVVKNIVTVTKEFGKVRQTFGAPLGINSGYRPPHLKIGASKSQHKIGLAVDIRPMNLCDIYELWDVMAKSTFVGLGRGMNRGFIHGDVRKTGRRVIFNY